MRYRRQSGHTRSCDTLIHRSKPMYRLWFPMLPNVFYRDLKLIFKMGEILEKLPENGALWPDVLRALLTWLRPFPQPGVPSW